MMKIQRPKQFKTKQFKTHTPTPHIVRLFKLFVTTYLLKMQSTDRPSPTVITITVEVDAAKTVVVAGGARPSPSTAETPPAANPPAPPAANPTAAVPLGPTAGGDISSSETEEGSVDWPHGYRCCAKCARSRNGKTERCGIRNTTSIKECGRCIYHADHDDCFPPSA